MNEIVLLSLSLFLLMFGLMFLFNCNCNSKPNYSYRGIPKSYFIEGMLTAEKFLNEREKENKK